MTDFLALFSAQCNAGRRPRTSGSSAVVTGLQPAPVKGLRGKRTKLHERDDHPTTGVEIGVAERVGGAAGLRMSAEFLKVGRNFESDGATYDTKLKFSSLGLYGDYFITGGGFRLSAGAVIGTRKATGNAVATNGTLSINGSSYPAAGESVGAEAKFPSAAPYIGIGYGHHQPSKGSGFYLDLGVVIGKANTTISPSAGIVAAAGQANVDAEQRKLQDSVDKLKAYPVLKFGFSFAF